MPKSTKPKSGQHRPSAQPVPSPLGNVTAQHSHPNTVVAQGGQGLESTIPVPTEPTPAPPIPPESIDAAPKEQKYHWSARIVTTTDTLEMNGEVALTKEEINAKGKEMSEMGFVFYSPDGLRITTYMPRNILRIIWNLRAAE